MLSQIGTVYIDGFLTMNDTNSSLAINTTVTPQTYKMIAISCKYLNTNNIKGGGILVSIDGSAFGTTMFSDISWKCNRTYYAGWYDVNFDDSSWSAAVVLQANTNGPTWPYFPQMGSAKWIGPIPYQVQNPNWFYCRSARIW